MSVVKTLELGHPKSRASITNKTIISVQGVKFYAHTMEDAAKVQLFVQALEGKGPLSKVFKEEAKKLVDKFEKANPEFVFAVVGRKCGSKNKDKTPMKKETKKSSKPMPRKTSSKPTKKSKEAMEELAVAS